MAKNVIINEVTYNSIPYIDVPRSDSSGDARFFDTTGADISANDIRKGKNGFGANGEVAGNLETITPSTQYITAKAQEISIAAGIHSTGGVVKLPTADVNNIVAGNIRKDVQILGITGTLSSVSVTQDPSTKALRIS